MKPGLVRSRPTRRDPSRHVEPCGCNPYAGVICPACQDAYRASDVCWHCMSGDKAAMREGVPVCAACLRAFSEAGAA